MPRKTAPTTLDHYDRLSSPLSIIEHFVPAPTNHDPLGLRVSMAWADAQVCPDHGMKWTHVRARWQRVGRFGTEERPAVMFLCPLGHAWEVVLKEHAGEGSEQ